MSTVILGMISANLVTIVATGSAIAVGCYVYFVFYLWQKDFSGLKLGRNNASCPSNKQPPPVLNFEHYQQEVIESAEKHEQFKTCELVADVKEKRKRDGIENVVLRQRAKRISFQDGSTFENGSKNNEEIAEGLDMDHVYVRFEDFLWGFFFIVPFSMFLWIRGTFFLIIREKLNCWGILKAQECDYEKLCATLILEQSQVIHYFAKTKKGSELGNIAGFFFSHFPYVDNDCNFIVADIFAVDIDLDTKRFVKAKLDDRNITAKETMILLWYNTIAAQHVKLHSMANWGVNPQMSVDQVNPFLRQNSVVTTLYNYFGYVTFSSFLQVWEYQQLLNPGWVQKGPLLSTFKHGIAEGVKPHPHITELVPYSRFVNFAVKVRSIFITEFANHKHLFPGIDGEAMFVGTVLHSLDHTLMEWNMVDPLWLDVNHPEFGVMAKMGRIVRAGFVEDVPMLYFQKRFKGSKHPFYKAVYEKAAKIDKKLADYMDTCIVK